MCSRLSVRTGNRYKDVMILMFQPPHFRNDYLYSMLSQVVEPIFIVLNSFQGLFIFLLYCVRKPMVRKQWGLTCLAARVRRQDVTTSSSGTHSSKNTSSSAATDVVLVSMSKIPKEKSIEVSIHVKP